MWQKESAISDSDNPELIEIEGLGEYLAIIPELENLLPPLGDDEKSELRRSIEEEGFREQVPVWVTEFKDKTVWVLLDGHNRLRIWQALGGNAYKPTNNYGLRARWTESRIDSLDDAKQWIIINQLMRRNLTDEQRAYFRGKAYEAAKSTGFKGNQYTKNGRGQNDLKQNSAEKLAKRHGVSASTIKRDGVFSRWVGTLSPEDKVKALAGDLKMPKIEKSPKEASGQSDRMAESEHTVENLANNHESEDRNLSDVNLWSILLAYRFKSFHQATKMIILLINRQKNMSDRLKRSAPARP